MSEHTPGPWHAYKPTGEYHHWISAGADCRDIASARGGSSLAEQEANANLIAASPDMLNALRRILPYCMETNINPEPTPLYEYYHASKAVRAAIAKAEGKP
jgi:hypothetical protein